MGRALRAPCVVFAVVLAVALLSLAPLSERAFVSYDDEHNFVLSRASAGLRAPGSVRWAFEAAVLGVWEPLAVLLKMALADAADALGLARARVAAAVSYTHLTLPTICSV